MISISTRTSQRREGTMKQFDVNAHPVHGFEVVKIGFFCT